MLKSRVIHGSVTYHDRNHIISHGIKKEDLIQDSTKNVMFINDDDEVSHHTTKSDGSFFSAHSNEDNMFVDNIIVSLKRESQSNYATINNNDCDGINEPPKKRMKMESDSSSNDNKSDVPMIVKVEIDEDKGNSIRSGIHPAFDDEFYSKLSLLLAYINVTNAANRTGTDDKEGLSDINNDDLREKEYLMRRQLAMNDYLKPKIESGQEIIDSKSNEDVKSSVTNEMYDVLLFFSKMKGHTSDIHPIFDNKFHMKLSLLSSYIKVTSEISGMMLSYNKSFWKDVSEREDSMIRHLSTSTRMHVYPFFFNQGIQTYGPPTNETHQNDKSDDDDDDDNGNSDVVDDNNDSAYGVESSSIRARTQQVRNEYQRTNDVVRRPFVFQVRVSM